jgi:hypothetical protein
MRSSTIKNSADAFSSQTSLSGELLKKTPPNNDTIGILAEDFPIFDSR